MAARGIRLVLGILGLAGGLLAQAPGELATFIVQEFRAAATEAIDIKDARFTDGESAFKLTTGGPGQMVEQTLEFNLAEVDVYTQRMFLQNGKGDFICTYSLVAAPRGRGAGIRRNLGRVPGAVVLVEATPNATRIRSLELAFLRLTELVTGRRRPVPPVPETL